MDKTLLNSIAQIIFDKKGFNILALDVRGLSSITDYMLIAEGSVDRHIVAIAKNIIDVMAKQGVKPYRVEGMEFGDWIVLDYSDFMVHLFTSGLRDKYRIEKIWPDAKVIDLDLKTEKSQA